MVEWSLIIYCGIITFFSRYLIKKSFKNTNKNPQGFLQGGILLPKII